MKYLGGKYVLGKQIGPYIRDKSSARQVYYEPFFGGGGAFMGISAVLQCKKTILADVHAPLMSMWIAAVGGWQPPSKVSHAYYQSLDRKLVNPENGFIGFACSFGGKYFGSYARGICSNYAAAGKRSVLKTVSWLHQLKAEVHHESIFETTCRPSNGWLVYCDPPYAGTEQYKGARQFDHPRFWELVRTWTRNGAEVFVSEYNAPDDFTCVKEFRHMTNLNHCSKASNTHGVQMNRVERIFRYYK